MRHSLPTHPARRWPSPYSPRSHSTVRPTAGARCLKRPSFWRFEGKREHETSMGEVRLTQDFHASQWNGVSRALYTLTLRRRRPQNRASAEVKVQFLHQESIATNELPNRRLSTTWLVQSFTFPFGRRSCPPVSPTTYRPRLA